MPVCSDCRMIGGFHHYWCSRRHETVDRRTKHVNLIRYPRPNRLGLTPKDNP